MQHQITIDGPPTYQAYGARCTCGWIGPVEILKTSAIIDGELHLCRVEKELVS